MEHAPPLRRVDPNIVTLDQIEPAPGAPFQMLNQSVRWLWMVGPVIFWGIVLTALTVLALVERITGFINPSSQALVYRIAFIALPILGILALWHLVWPWVGYSRWGYAIRRNDLLIRYGVIWKRVIVVPFSRIQHVDSSAGPISRMLGLAQVDIHTAGTAMSRISIPGLEGRDAENLRDYLSKMGHAHANI